MIREKPKAELVESLHVAAMVSSSIAQTSPSAVDKLHGLTMQRVTALLALAALAGCGELIDLGAERVLTDAGAAGAGGGGGASDGGSGASKPAHFCDDASAFSWLKSFGDAAEDRISSVVRDGEGGVYVAGDFHGRIDFGDGPLVSAGEGWPRRGLRAERRPVLLGQAARLDGSRRRTHR